MKKILYIGGGNLINRGVEKYIFNVCCSLNIKEYSIDILTPGVCNNNTLRQIIKERNGEIIELNSTYPSVMKYIQFYIKLSVFFKTNNDYDIVEIQTGNIIILTLASLNALHQTDAKVICHTHSAHKQGIKFKLQRLFSLMMSKKCIYLACSKEAGKETFPAKVYNQIIVIPNFIDVEDFRFNERKREYIRKKYSIENKYVIGNVGAFVKSKNHEFLLDVFKEICIIKKDCVLMLVGEGELEEDIKKKAQKLGIANSIIFTGVTEEVYDMMSSMDVFVFPSKYEGLGITVIEAQANGLPCIVSEYIPEEANITDLFQRVSLQVKAAQWATTIIDKKEKYDRKEKNKEVLETRYACNKGIQYLEKVYSGGANRCSNKQTCINLYRNYAIMSLKERKVA